ncbi:MAG: YidC/Oxa1 family membrane protein insertase [Gaiellaceae bacterium]|jgi:YidC/Oxa1 family membrane protein insertase
MTVALLALLQPLEHLLRHVLNGLHQIGLPWAWAIIALTILVRMLLVPLTVRQIHSMQSMQAHAPQMKEIQRKYKGDRQKMNEELMKFYRENNINPAASCLPLVAQFPVFIGLYYTLRTFSKEPPPGDLSWLHFIPSIADKVTSHWGGYVILAVYVLSQLASTYFMSGTMQQSQRVIMMVLPFAFIFVIARFPTGLVLYWMTTNLWTVGQGLITRRLIPKTPQPAPGPKRSSRTPPKDEPPPTEDGAAAEPKAAAQTPAQPRRVKRKKKARR